MLKVVFDANVYVSAFGIPGSKSQEAFLLAAKGKIKLFTSPFLVAEVANKLREKFDIPRNDLLQTIRHIGKVALVLRPNIELKVLKDDSDNRILECAKEAKADLIITGDKHLLRLKEYQGIGIVRVADLLYTVRGQ